MCPQVQDILSRSPAWDEGFHIPLSADETSPALAAPRHAITALFSCRKNALALPGGNRIFAATPTERITHYTLRAKSCAKGLGVPCVWFAKSDWESGELVLSTLREHDIDFVVLAGFLARVPDNILHAYPNKMINIHPSLLPKFGGKGMYGDRVHEAVIASGEKESGITIHYTNEHYDEGGIICQQKCPVLPGDTPEELAQRIHRLEYEYYPKVIEELVEGLSPSYL